MTSALVGSRPFALAVDDPAGTAFRWADAEAGAVPEEAGSEAVPGTAEIRVSPLLGARVLLEAADEIVGTGPGLRVAQKRNRRPQPEPRWQCRGFAARTDAGVVATAYCRSPSFFRLAERSHHCAIVTWPATTASLRKGR